jgi:ATP-dependent helicase HrpB
VVRRLWDARDRLRPHREPEIHRVDLASTVLDVIAWGGDPRTLEWFERPHHDALEAALALLVRLELIERSGGSGGSGRLTALGDQVRRVPLHPRLARMLVAAGGARSMVRACALLSERHLLSERTAANTSSDLLSAIDRWSDVAGHVKSAAQAIEASVGPAITNLQPAVIPSESAFLRAVLSGYPDRVAQRRQPGSPECLLASGTGAVLARESGVRDGEFLVAIDVTATNAAPRIRIASRVEREWLLPTRSEVVHRIDAATGTVKAVAVDYYDALVLVERPIAVDAEIGARLLAEAWLARGPRDDDRRLLKRLKFSGHAIDLAEVVRTAAYGVKRLDDIDLSRALAPAVLRDIERDAPDMLPVPSGRQHRLDYNDDGTVGASVKLQELFGLAETPRIGRRGEPVVLSLLAPNGRPVQVTRDLRSFWDRTYPEVRKELRGRYPKHPWPEDPWTAPPTARAKRKPESLK